MRALLVAVVILLAPSLGRAQETGVVGGRVVDYETGEPVGGVLVTLQGLEPVLTAEDGVFLFRDVSAGAYQLVFEHLAYGYQSRRVFVDGGQELVLEAAISQEAIELEPLVVETLTELEERRISSGNSITEIASTDIERAARAGIDLGSLLDTSMPGVDVRPGPGGSLCVQYRAIRTGNNRGDCDGVSVVLDGVPVADPSYIYATLPLQEIEHLEIMSPGQAGVRYGMRTGQSVLIIQTKRGRAEQRASLDDLVTGFDWSGESEPYPWMQVFGSAFLANAAGVGIGLLMADKCFWTPELSSFALRTRCAGVETAGAGVLSVALPAIGGSLLARWAGQTTRSRGRFAPAVVTTGMVLSGGYLLLIAAEGAAAQTVGGLVLGLAAPLTLTFSDRVFRVLR